MLSPVEVVSAAAAAGVELLALSDRDTTAGVPEAQDMATEVGIEVVAAVEITATFEGHQDLHVLGYLIDPADRSPGRGLARSRSDREQRAEGMADANASSGSSSEWKYTNGLRAVA